MDILQRIDRLRMDRQWSLSQLATAIGVWDTTVYSWFNDCKYQPSRQTIEDICCVFGITMAVFYSEVDLDKVSAREAVLLEAFRGVPESRKDKIVDIVKSFAE